MANDNVNDNLRRRNFEGTVPISITLGRSDQVLFGVQSQDLYLQLPRFNYILAYTDKIYKYFERYLCSNSSKREIWFSDKQSEANIKHNYPIGVIYDLYHQSVSPVTPLWSLVVHFQNFPLDELVQQTSPNLVELGYMYSLKEADALVHNGSVIQSMSEKDHKTLWICLCDGDFEKFHSVNTRLTSDPVNKIPFRVHRLRQPTLQRLIESHIKAENRESRVSDVLAQCKVDRVILNGLRVDPETSLLWLFQNLAFADNFLHFVEC